MITEIFDDNQLIEIKNILSKYQDVKFLLAWEDITPFGEVEFINALYIVSELNKAFYLYIEKNVYYISKEVEDMEYELKENLYPQSKEKLLKILNEEEILLKNHPILESKLKHF
jgi:hypothetical protein